ncbi:MAG: DEAD/DEAH box helicase [Haliscomenobacter sp.]|nr:DEAD/DEAH box helicase [Haliscomenobacter sp.]
MKFTEFGFNPAILEGLDAMGFKDATPVQELAIPKIMAGQDVLACAQTGTGKTAAFLLPILHTLTESPSEYIDTLILEPTRELVMQVDQQLEGFSYFTPASAVAVYGGRDGHSMEMERRALKQGAQIIVATPGRLIAHIDLGYVKFDNLRHLVLDEADRMLDMGFAPDIMKIVNELPRNRQTLLFSATMPPQIRRMAKEFLRSPSEISLSVSKPAENIMQIAYQVEDEAKIPLAELLLTGKKQLQRVLIFVSTKIKVRELAERLIRRGMNAAAIHSDLEQSEREVRLLAFRNGTLPIVVATDVLARGIDIKGIDVVINFDVPGDGEDYVHRIGRTARADASGIAITFVNRKDRGRFKRIEELIGTDIRLLPLPPEVASIPSKPSSPSNSPRGQKRPFRNGPKPGGGGGFKKRGPGRQNPDKPK